MAAKKPTCDDYREQVDAMIEETRQLGALNEQVMTLYEQQMARMLPILRALLDLSTGDVNAFIELLRSIRDWFHLQLDYHRTYRQRIIEDEDAYVARFRAKFPNKPMNSEMIKKLTEDKVVYKWLKDDHEEREPTYRFAYRQYIYYYLLVELFAHSFTPFMQVYESLQWAQMVTAVQVFATQVTDYSNFYTQRSKRSGKDFASYMQVMVNRDRARENDKPPDGKKWKDFNDYRYMWYNKKYAKGVQLRRKPEWLNCIASRENDDLAPQVPQTAGPAGGPTVVTAIGAQASASAIAGPPRRTTSPQPSTSGTQKSQPQKRKLAETDAPEDVRDVMPRLEGEESDSDSDGISIVGSYRPQPSRVGTIAQPQFTPEAVRKAIDAATAFAPPGSEGWFEVQDVIHGPIIEYEPPQEEPLDLSATRPLEFSDEENDEPDNEDQT